MLAAESAPGGAEPAAGTEEDAAEEDDGDDGDDENDAGWAQWGAGAEPTDDKA